MPTPAPFLIIIRGNSGSGKSTLARELRLKLVERGMNVALVEQDYLRRIILKEKEIDNGVNIRLIEQTVRFALDNGYSAILEGTLFFSCYGAMLERIAKVTDRTLVYYFDVPFEETLRRHITKPNSNEFGEAEMRGWWKEHDVTHFPGEKIIPVDSALEATVEMILKDVDAQ